MLGDQFIQAGQLLLVRQPSSLKVLRARSTTPEPASRGGGLVSPSSGRTHLQQARAGLDLADLGVLLPVVRLARSGTSTRATRALAEPGHPPRSRPPSGSRSPTPVIPPAAPNGPGKAADPILDLPETQSQRYGSEDQQPHGGSLPSQQDHLSNLPSPQAPEQAG